MANKNTGELIKKAMEEGRVQQCTAHKKDGARCSRPARIGYNTCPSHGAGTRKREIEGIRKPPGRPSIANTIYDKTLTKSEKETFLEAIGDLTLVHEVARAKTEFVNLLQEMKKYREYLEQQECECEVYPYAHEFVSESGTIEYWKEVSDFWMHQYSSTSKQFAKYQERVKLQNDAILFAKVLESVTKTTVAAWEQMQGKKIQVTLIQPDGGTNFDTIDKVKEIVKKELEFIHGIICENCQQRIMESMRDRQRTTFDDK